MLFLDFGFAWLWLCCCFCFWMLHCTLGSGREQGVLRWLQDLGRLCVCRNHHRVSAAPLRGPGRLAARECCCSCAIGDHLRDAHAQGIIEILVFAFPSKRAGALTWLDAPLAKNGLHEARLWRSNLACFRAASFSSNILMSASDKGADCGLACTANSDQKLRFLGLEGSGGIGAEARPFSG